MPALLAPEDRVALAPLPAALRVHVEAAGAPATRRPAASPSRRSRAAPAPSPRSASMRRPGRRRSRPARSRGSPPGQAATRWGKRRIGGEPNAVPNRRIRNLLPDHPRDLVGADAAPAVVEDLHRRSELRLLRHGQLEVLLPARRASSLGNHLFARADRRRAPTCAARSSSSPPSSPSTCCARRLQVLRVLRRGRGPRLRLDRGSACRCRCSRSRCRSGSASSRSRRSPTWSTPTAATSSPRAAARRRGVPELLLAPRRRADRARLGVPAADREAARP